MDRAKRATSRKPAPAAGEPQQKRLPQPPPSWQTFLLAMAAGAMLWAALPPLGWWPLAWLAPLPWLWLIQAEQMPGRRPYLAVWVAAFLHWLVVLQGIRLAHPALYAGWIALSWYLAFYPLLFVAISRRAVHRAGVPLLLAGPAAWVALELVRGHLITGFSAALLGHTQYEQAALIQLSDSLGAYGVSFVVMFVAAALASGLPWRRWFPKLIGASREQSSKLQAAMSWQPVPLLAAVLLLVCCWGYGAMRMAEHRAKLTSWQAEVEPLHVALLQENVATIFDYDRQRSIDTYRRYLNLAATTVQQHAEVELVMWPESAFNSVQPLFEFGPRARPPEEMGWSEEEFEMRKSQMVRPAQLKAQGAAVQLQERAAMLVGVDLYRFDVENEHFNAAALYSPQGELLDTYGKMHRVMFGEYIPLGDEIPWLYSITPMANGLTAGTRPEAFPVEGVNLAPSICFESVVPHLIRRQVLELAERGETPDVLVNITNDGWFHGSSILDLHHICSVFRAVENRRPMLVAANIGITAEIDAAGRVQQKLPRREVDAVIARVYPAPQELTFYTRWGDLFAAGCLLATVVALTLATFRPSAGNL